MWVGAEWASYLGYGLAFRFLPIKKYRIVDLSVLVAVPIVLGSALRARGIWRNLLPIEYLLAVITFITTAGHQVIVPPNLDGFRWIERDINYW